MAGRNPAPSPWPLRGVQGLLLATILAACGGGGGGPGASPVEPPDPPPPFPTAPLSLSVTALEAELSPEDIAWPDNQRVDLYRLTLPEEQEITVRMISADCDARLAVYRPQCLDEGDISRWGAYRVAEDDNGDGGTDARLRVRLSAGDHVVAAFAGQLGRYTLVTHGPYPVHPLGLPAAVDAALSAGDLRQPGGTAIDLYRLRVDEETPVRVSAEATDFTVRVSLYHGQALAEPDLHQWTNHLRATHEPHEPAQLELLLPAGDHVVAVQGNGFGPYRLHATVVDPEPVRPVFVFARLADSDGAPLAGATFEASGTQQTHADPGGHAYLELPPGQYTIRATHEGTSVWTDTVNVPEGAQTLGLGEIRPRTPYYALAIAWYRDADLDGYSSGAYVLSRTQPPGHQPPRYFDEGTATGDCNDDDLSVNPNAFDIPGDSIDQNCDGADTPRIVRYKDADGDGYSDGALSYEEPAPEGFVATEFLAATEGDCNDFDPATRPYAPETLDGADNNCNGIVDESWLPWYRDEDGDRHSDGSYVLEQTPPPLHFAPAELVSLTDDCNDLDPDVYPGAVEIAADGADQDCDGLDPSPGIEPVPDPALLGCLAKNLSKDPRSLTLSDLMRLTALTCDHAGIENLTGLHQMANLVILSIQSNRISDLSPLLALPWLDTLYLGGNCIDNLAPVGHVPHVDGTRAQAPACGTPVTLVEPITGIELLWVPAGTYRAGGFAPDDPADTQPLHTVIFTRSFFLGRTEVTQGQWGALTGELPQAPESPKTSVSWEAATRWAHDLALYSGYALGLPTEAQWEYAARALGLRHRWAGTDDEQVLPEYAWGLHWDLDTPQPVASLRANNLGLFDMSGNTSEWCSDWYAPYAMGASTNPSGPPSGVERVVRGGSYRSGPDTLRVTRRGAADPTLATQADVGFRLACPAD